MRRERKIIKAKIGMRIAIRRIEMGLSQSAIADACGTSFQQVQKYESGHCSPTLERLYRIAEQLSVPVSYFFEDCAPDDIGESPGPNAKTSNRERLEAMKAFGEIPDRRVRNTLSYLMRALSSD